MYIQKRILTKRTLTKFAFSSDDFHVKNLTYELSCKSKGNVPYVSITTANIRNKKSSEIGLKKKLRKFHKDV